ncbi:Uncharacterized protein TCM_026229 [Theobroma cacao]|uniref:Uncharacterized protein n=1 Tax=Theobroma cacao TaxID=3641 RepID=A0A061F0T7_THECC|nr:Uncharacterized protein TCM_026229 [Theobroma cacao]
MATISYFLVFIMLIQGTIIFSNSIPMVEASRGLAYLENLTPPPPPPPPPPLSPPPSSNSSQPTRTLPSAPPSPTANSPSIDSKPIDPH